MPGSSPELSVVRCLRSLETPPGSIPRPSGSARRKRTVAASTGRPPRQAWSQTILVTGEPGTGRTTTARRLAGGTCAVFDAADSVVDETRWLLDVRAALQGDKPVVIDNIDALSSRLAGLLASPVQACNSQVVLAGAPLAALDGQHRALASLALTRHDLQPLRTYPHKLAGMVKSLLAELLPNSTIEIAPSNCSASRHNRGRATFANLRAVLDHAARGRERG